MDRVKDFIASYLTGFLSILLVLNVIIIFFSMMGITWQQFLQFTSNMTTLISDSSHYILHDSHQTGTDDLHVIRRVSGVVADPNIKLVCSDETFAQAAAKVRPGVVSITCDVFRSDGNSVGATSFDDPAPNLSILGGIGSGIIVEKSGYILTCYHMVATATNIYVIPFGYEEKKYKAKITAIDETLNLAILKINCPYPLKEVCLGDSGMIEIADLVLAIGNPFGLEQSVTHGVISDSQRDLMIKGRIYRDMIQTDAPINKGSSGGALVNMSGEVIGINMAIYSSTGVYNGISFALPINQAKQLLAKNLNISTF